VLFTITTVNGLPTATVSNAPSVIGLTEFPQSLMIPWSTAVGIDNLNSLVTTLEADVTGPWLSGGTLVLAGTTGGGTVNLSGATIAYNKYKLNGQTFYWQVQVRGASVAGTVDTFKLQTPTGFFLSGATWANIGGIVATAAAGTAYSSPPYIMLIDILGEPYIQFGISNGGAFPIGATALNFDINICAEVS
jgi:hypothetical protein